MDSIKIGSLELQPWQIGAGAIVVVVGMVAYFKNTSAPVMVPPTASTSNGLASANLDGAGGESVGTMEAMSELAGELVNATETISDLTKKINDQSSLFASYETNTNAVLGTITNNIQGLKDSMNKAPVITPENHQTSTNIANPVTTPTPAPSAPAGINGSKLSMAQKDKVVNMFPEWASQNAKKGWSNTIIPADIAKAVGV